MLPCKIQVEAAQGHVCQVCSSPKQVTKLIQVQVEGYRFHFLMGGWKELMTDRLSTIDVFKTFGLSVRTREVAIKRGKKYSEQRSANAKVGGRD